MKGRLKHRRSALRALTLLLLLALLASACSSITRSRGEIIKHDPIEATNPYAQERFDAAVEALEAGRYDEAVEAFRLIQAEFASDAIALMAELYIARAIMGDVDAAMAHTEVDPTRHLRTDEAARVLAALMEDRSVDDRVRYGAQAYFALELAIRGQTEEALLALRSYPGPSVSPAVLKGDRLAVFPLIAESMYRAHRSVDALDALRQLHDAVLAELPPELDDDILLDSQLSDSQVGHGPLVDSQRVADLKALRGYARTRGFEIGGTMLTEAQRHELVTSDSYFLRAAAGWGILEGKVDQATSDQEREAIEALFNRIAPDFVKLDAMERAAELSVRLAAIGGSKRLAIGALLPLTGPNRVVGQRAMAGMLVALRAFHFSGEPSVTVIFQDSNADAQAAFDALLAQHVLAIIGPLDLVKSKEFAVLAARYGVPLMTMSPESMAADAHPKLEPAAQPDGAAAEPLNFVFRNFLHATAEARAVAQVSFQEMGDRRAAVVYPDIGYGRVMAEAFAREFRARGGQVVFESAYDRSINDYAGTARRVAAAKPDAIFIPDTAGKVAEVSAFLAAENIWGMAPDKRQSPRAQRQFVHYLGTSLWHDPILVRQASSYVSGAVFPAWYSPAFDTPESQDFASRFQGIFGRSPDNFEAFAFDSILRLRFLLVDRGVVNRPGLRDALAGEDTFSGVTGPFRFDAAGEPIRGLRFLTVQSEDLIAYPITIMTGGAPGSATEQEPDRQILD